MIFHSKKSQNFLKFLAQPMDIMKLETVKSPLKLLYSCITPNDFLGFSSDFAGTDISKNQKLCNFIQKENINIDKLLEMLELIKNINK